MASAPLGILRTGFARNLAVRTAAGRPESQIIAFPAMGRDRPKFPSYDNRENSADSRYWGYLPMDLVKGRALFIYFSTASQHWWDMPFYIRWKRLFKILH